MKGWIIFDESKPFSPFIGHKTPVGHVPITFNSKQEAQQNAESRALKSYSIAYGGN